MSFEEIGIFKCVAVLKCDVPATKDINLSQLAVVANAEVVTVERDLVLTLVKLMLACRRCALVNVVEHR